MSNFIKISVRALVEFVLRSGSIDSTFKGSSALVEGVKAHQKVQKKQDEKYKKEVHLKTNMKYKNFYFQIEGRCDGLIEDDEITIDEIKSTTKGLEHIEENHNPVHWAQAKLYGFMYGKDNNLESLYIQLTYFDIDSEEEKIFKKKFTLYELETFTYELLDKYIEFAALKIEIGERRDKSIKELAFPFERYRAGQRELAVAVYSAILNEKRLFAKAPTGIGKTVSTIFPAVKALGEEKIEKIIYLTAKTITRTVAEETFSLLRAKGLSMKVLTLTAKEKVCFKDEINCHKDYCEYADGYYDRLNEAILDILKNEDKLDRDNIKEYSQKHRVCPFEFSLDLATLVDCIICDYNYIFDPRVSLKRFVEENKKNYVVLIDEAHNLVDRARDMFSATLSKSRFLELKKLFKNEDKGIYKLLEKINSHMLEFKKECDEENYLVKKDKPKEIFNLLNGFIAKSEKWLTRNNKKEGYKELLDLYFECTSFIRISRLYDERYVTVIEKERNEVMLKLFCLDPSFLLHEVTQNNKATVFFSATLIPLPYYKEVLGGEKDDYTITLKSPFNPENLKIYVSDLSTRYKDRENTYKYIVDKITGFVNKNQGNYLFFFPSYKYMNQVYELFMEKNQNIKTIIQSNAMSEGEREEFLNEFKEENKDTLIGFAVLGGIFSEGIDLKGDRLKGVFIVGVGLPQVCLERDIIKEYYDSIDKNGYDYSYIFPGMNKVLQAGGRLIRTETDKGTLLLIDDRFLYHKYRVLFPDEWKHFKVIKS